MFSTLLLPGLLSASLLPAVLPAAPAPLAPGAQDAPSLGSAQADALPPADAEVTAEALEHHVRFLASDELRGRRAGSDDTRRAAAYLARALARAGLEPFGDGGSYFQRVDLAVTEWEGPPELVLHAGDEAVPVPLGEQWSVRVNGDARTHEGLRIVHVRAEEDVPEAAAEDVALLFHSSSTQSRKWLEARSHPDGAGFGLLLRVGTETPGRPQSGLRGGRISLADPDAVDAPEVITLRGPAAVDADRWTAVDVRFHGGPQVVPDANVVGVIRGVGTADAPELKDEVVVLSAHYDHIGMRPSEGAEEGEDLVNNGADDDASGVATVLELAEALAAGPPPARTVVVLLATAEEQGILGTKHFVQHPPVPLERIVCNLNFEMLGRPDDAVGGSGKLWLTGYERSSLGPAMGALGVGVMPDARPDQNFFARSDNIVFVVEGIVGQTFSTYNMHGDYHQPGDEAGALDYAHMQGAARACLQAVRLVTGGQVTPTWNEGEPKLR